MIKIKKLKPLFTGVLTTGDKYEKDFIKGGIVIAKEGDLKLYQTVLAIGSSVRELNVGDKVMIDPIAYAQMKYDPNSVKNDFDMTKVVKWNLPRVMVENEEGEEMDCLLLNERDIKFVYEGEEKESESILVYSNQNKIHLG